MGFGGPGTGKCPAKKSDFDGDRKADTFAYCPRNNYAYWDWPIRYTSSGQSTNLGTFGLTYDRAVLGDFEGDGKTDRAVYDTNQNSASAGNWFIIKSSLIGTPNYTYDIVHYGEPSIAPGDEPLADTDFDGDGITDLAVWRRATGEWFYKKSSAGGQSTNLGKHGDGYSSQYPYYDLPMPGDWEGDGKTDRMIWRPSNGHWYVYYSSQPGSPVVDLGEHGYANDIPIPGDWDGDGKFDRAIFRPSNGHWYVYYSSRPGSPYVDLGGHGGAGDVPVPGDFEGDGKYDRMIFRPADQGWYVYYSSQPGSPYVISAALPNSTSACITYTHYAIAASPTSPIVIDTQGNGIRLTSTSEGVNFDFGGFGARVRTAWTTPGTDDAFLVLDRDSNGTIDNGRELFGDATVQPPSYSPHGFLALAEYDNSDNGGNGDGVVDGQDAVFASLQLWKDVDHNGQSEAGELSALSGSEVSAIELDYQESRRTDQYGNQFKYRARVLDGRGRQVGRWAWDVFFSVQL